MNKKQIAAKAEKKLVVCMNNLDRLIASIEGLETLASDYRAQGLGPKERPFYWSKKYSWPHTRLTGLKAWRDQYDRTFGDKTHD